MEQDKELRVQSSEFRVKSYEFRVQSSEFRGEADDDTNFGSHAILTLIRISVKQNS